MTTSPNTLILPFRTGAHVSYNNAIRQYINTQYDQHPDMFRDDLDVIDALRRDAVTVREAHASGIKRLQAYAAQLVWLGGKFPIDIGVDFPWYPAFGVNADRPAVRNNLKYELLNTLFNLSALYCHLADSTSRSTPEGIKTAASYFSQAAGVLAHMRSEILPVLRMSDPPEDLDDTTLEALENLCLAEAQECFWQKAVTDGYKDGIIAKLAARVSELYGEAKGASIQSTALPSQWIYHMGAKRWHFAAAAQYRAACECLEKRKYGEEVARLKEALACVGEGLKETKSGQVNKGVVGDLNGIKKRIEADLKRAERDNDVIYLQNVPTKTELKDLDKVNMAIAKCPDEVSNPLEYLGEDSKFGLPLFSKLVPFAVHLAISIYEKRRDRVVTKDIIEPLDDISETLNATLDSLGLPGSLQALEKPLGLPPSLIQRAEEVRQANALVRVQDSLHDVDSLKANDMAVFEEGRELINRELEEDERMRRTYGAAWTRPTSREDETGKKLWTRLGEIERYFKDSTASDKLVRDKFDAIRGPLSVLCGSDRALHDYVPSSRRQEIPEGLRMILGRLRSSYNDVQRLQSRRRKKIELLREKARGDDIRAEIIREAARLERTYPGISIEAATFDEWMEARLDTMYENEIAGIATDEAEQGRIVGELIRVNREFASQKRIQGNREGKEREEVLQRLNSAYDRYKEILEGAEAGRKFYNDLRRIVDTMFTDVTKVWANDRRLEAEAMEEEILLPPLARARISSPPATVPTQYHQQPVQQLIQQQQQRQQQYHQPYEPQHYEPTPSIQAPVAVSAHRDSELIREPDLVHEVSIVDTSTYDSSHLDETIYKDGVSSFNQEPFIHKVPQRLLPSVPSAPPQPPQTQPIQPQAIPVLQQTIPKAQPVAPRPVQPQQVQPQPQAAPSRQAIPASFAQWGVPQAGQTTAWTPDMGIKFSNLPPAPTKTPRVAEGEQSSNAPRKVWDPAAGIKFG